MSYSYIVDLIKNKNSIIVGDCPSVWLVSYNGACVCRKHMKPEFDPIVRVDTFNISSTGDIHIQSCFICDSSPTPDQEPASKSFISKLVELVKFVKIVNNV